jgi:hypothetical protein
MLTPYVLSSVDSTDEHGHYVRDLDLMLRRKFSPDPRWKEPHLV